MSKIAWFRLSFFFFKQKTAYEIGLGIPAEPLFRSGNHNELNQDDARYGFRCCHLKNIWTAPLRSEERRVGKECRSRGAAEPLVQNESRTNPRISAARIRSRTARATHPPGRPHGRAC